MAMGHLMLSLSPCSRCFWNCIIEERRKFNLPSLPPRGGAFSMLMSTIGQTKRLSTERSDTSVRRDLARRSALKASEVETGQIGGLVEVPVTCYQFLGLSLKAEKDEVVKAVMDLKGSDIESGYTGDAIVSRQQLLMDIRDKLLFEPEYAGNLKENIPPKSCLRILWAWLPGALCLLQEVGEEKIVLAIGRAALEHSDVKPYVHDVILSMTLAECAIAKVAFEKNKVYEGFEALARAQYLLKSKVSLESMPLLSQIEESLEELAPACTLELLNLPQNSDNAEQRRGAIAALRELLKQGLDVETSCRVQDWHGFLSQAFNKLMASEIVDLLSWENLSSARKNKKILESQNQRVVIDFDCFYLAMIAHLALGFSTRQIDLISKAKIICECLIASEGVDLKFEDALLSFLLGQGSEVAAFEKLQQLEIKGNSSLRSSAADNSTTEFSDKQAIYRSLEKWLKDAALSLFPDTRDCTASLATFFRGPKKIINGSNKKIGTTASFANNSPPSFSGSCENTSLVEHLPIKSFGHMGEAVKQLAPVNLQTQTSINKVTSMISNPSKFPLNRNTNPQSSKFVENWCRILSNILGRVVCTTFVGCIILSILKILSTELGQPRISDMLHFNQLKNMMAHVNQNYRQYPADRRRKTENSFLLDDLPSLARASAVVYPTAASREMPSGEAESLLKQWQDIKAEALGPEHSIHALPAILSESMLSKWQDLAFLAKNRGCFWRFVLLNLSVLRTETVIDDLGTEFTEVEAVIEEAAELVSNFQQKKPTYHSAYKVRYVLKRQGDGCWRLCGGGIDSSA